METFSIFYQPKREGGVGLAWSFFPFWEQLFSEHPKYDSFFNDLFEPERLVFDSF